MEKNFTYFARTRAGVFKLTASKHGILSIRFPESGCSRLEEIFPAGIKKNCKIAEKWLASYFKSSGRRPKLPKLDDRAWSPMRRRMSRELLRIKEGGTYSYLEFAKRCGIPKGARAIGRLLSSNPLPVIIPCHRILSTNGLGGFSGGLNWKKKLLRHEGSLE